MKLSILCDFCLTRGDWEGALVRDRRKLRQCKAQAVVAVFPANRQWVPSDWSWNPEVWRERGVLTAAACPKCLTDFKGLRARDRVLQVYRGTERRPSIIRPVTSSLEVWVSGRRFAVMNGDDSRGDYIQLPVDWPNECRLLPA